MSHLRLVHWRSRWEIFVHLLSATFTSSSQSIPGHARTGWKPSAISMYQRTCLSDSHIWMVQKRSIYSTVKECVWLLFFLLHSLAFQFNRRKHEQSKQFSDILFKFFAFNIDTFTWRSRTNSALSSDQWSECPSDERRTETRRSL